MSYKIVPQECPTRVSHKSFLQERPTRVSHKSVQQECPTRVSHKSVPQEFPTRAPHKSVPQECPIRVSGKSVIWTYVAFRTCLHSGSWAPSCLLYLLFAKWSGVCEQLYSFLPGTLPTEELRKFGSKPFCLSKHDCIACFPRLDPMCQVHLELQTRTW